VFLIFLVQLLSPIPHKPPFCISLLLYSQDLVFLFFQSDFFASAGTPQPPTMSKAVATENPIPLHLIAAEGRETVVGFRHGTVIADIQQHWLNSTPYNNYCAITNNFIVSMWWAYKRRVRI